MSPAIVYITLFFTAILPLPTLAADCNTPSFSVLATSPAVVPCLQRTNIAVTTVETTLSPEQLELVCTTPACRQLLDALVALRLTECTIPFGGRPRLHADLMQPTIAYCAKVDSSVSARNGSHDSEHQSANATVPEKPTNETTTVPLPTSGSLKSTTATIYVALVACVPFLVVEI